MTRARHLLLPLVAGASLLLGCSGSTSRDMYFNTDAGSGFEPPIAEVSDTANDTEDADADVQGTAGAAGGTAGAGGAAGASADAAVDTVSDGAVSETPAGQ